MNSAQQEIQNAPRAGEYPVFPEWSPETAGFGGSAELPVIPLIEPTILPAHVPYLMPDISSLMMAMTNAMAQGPGHAANTLAQTFHPLVNMAVSLQLKALNDAAGNDSSLNLASFMGMDAMAVEDYYGNGAATENAAGPSTSGAHPAGFDTRQVSARQPSGGEPTEAEDSLAKAVNAAGLTHAIAATAGQRSSRKRKMSLKFSQYVDVDDELEKEIRN